MIMKNQYPILEYDTEIKAVINPTRHNKGDLPKKCLVTFCADVIKKYVDKNKPEVINTYWSEVREFPVYSLSEDICLIQGAVGSAAIAMQIDYIAAYGVKNIIACGACGVLDNIPSGKVIIPTSALRDEGTSYHYIPPSRTIELDKDIINKIKDTLHVKKTGFIECMTWTTDGFYRETPDMIKYRKEEGCTIVEMECATMAAVAKFRNISFGQLFYSGDLLIEETYDERNWFNNLTAREKLFYLTLAVLKSV